MARLERDIKAAIFAALGAHRDVLVMDNPSGVAYHADGSVTPYGVGLAHRGGSDIIGVGPGGRFLGLEVKSATGRQRPEQLKFEAAVRARGGEYQLLRSADEALEWLHQFRRRHG